MNPIIIMVIGVLLLVFSFGNGLSHRPESRTESFAGCAMPNYPTERQIAECHAWQAEKEARR